MTSLRRPSLGAIAVVGRTIAGRFHFALVQRAKDPNRGAWGFPGGHVEWGETITTAALRELTEETTLKARAVETLPPVDVIGTDDAGTVTHHFALGVVLCTYVSGTLTAQDDAAQAKWIATDDIETLYLPLLPKVADLCRLAQDRLRDKATDPSAATP